MVLHAAQTNGLKKCLNESTHTYGCTCNKSKEAPQHTSFRWPRVLTKDLQVVILVKFKYIFQVYFM